MQRSWWLWRWWSPSGPGCFSLWYTVFANFELAVIVRRKVKFDGIIEYLDIIIMRNTDLLICTWIRERNICTTAASWRRGILDTGLYVLYCIADWEVMWSGMFQRVLGCFDNLRGTLCSPTTVPVFLFTIFDFDSEKTHFDQHVGMWRSETQKLWWHHK